MRILAVKKIKLDSNRWCEFHYENEFGGVRDIDIPFEGVVNNIKAAITRQTAITLAPRCVFYMNDTCELQWRLSMNCIGLFVWVV